jgi:ADP-ribose pyrophosphatase
MDKQQQWQTLHSELVFDHRWYKVRRDRVALPNGVVIDDYFLSVRPDVALVFAITQNQEVVFVRQYRHGAGKVLLELPAGTFQPEQEEAVVAAQRELQEETGYRSDQLLLLGILYDNPVKETNKIHLFLAQHVYQQSEQALDITEDIEVVLVPINKVMTLISRGEVCVSGSVAAVFLAMSYLQEL